MMGYKSCTPPHTPHPLVERPKCSTGHDVLVTEFIKIDSHNPFHKQITNHLLNVTLAFPKGQAVSSFVPEYLESFQVCV